MDITSFVLGYTKGKNSASPGGGGGNVVNVTFVGANNSVLFVKPCIAGDDCFDPVVTGKINTPVKSSTPEFMFTYIGWSLTPDGEVDESALKTITEDRTVYAVFSESVIYYTINFYDGDRLIESKPVAYNVVPTVDIPGKDGYLFTAWEPELAPVTGDANYYAQWEESLSFAAASWERVSEMSKSGEASSAFKIGDEKVEDGRTFRIIAFNHESTTDGIEYSMTIMCYRGVPVRGINLGNNTSGGYLSSVMYSTALRAEKESLATSLQSAMRSVRKACDAPSSTSSTVSTILTTDPWLFSVTEVFGEGAALSDTPFLTQGTQYDYFKDSSNRVLTDEDGTAYAWWLRSTSDASKAISNNYTGWLRVKETGELAVSAYNAQNHAVYGFCV